MGPSVGMVTKSQPNAAYFCERVTLIFPAGAHQRVRERTAVPNTVFWWLDMGRWRTRKSAPLFAMDYLRWLNNAQLAADSIVQQVVKPVNSGV